MNIRRSVFAPVLVALVALVTGGWFLQQGVTREGNIYSQARLLQDVLNHIADRYVDEKDPSELYRMAIDGLLRELGDPHTSFMTELDYDRLRVQTQGEYGGLGIQIDVRDGWVTVIAPLPGTPAERAGMRSGDRIVEVDGESTRGWDSDRAVQTLRGPKGHPVDLRVARVGVDELIEFRIVRDDIHVPAVTTAYITGDGIGYVELTVFSENATDELRRAVDDLRSQGMRGLILDLRRNPGGLLDQGLAASDLFLPRGSVVLETRSRLPTQEHTYSARSPDQFSDLPVVVLLGPFSASASEILAGALQDHDRALVIGETSFGKGSVQTLYPLSGGNYLKLTTARWYTPAGRSIQRQVQRGDGHALATGDAQAVPDAFPADAQTTDAPLAEYRTAGGRTVYGGGGIHPDIVVEPDRPTQAEEAFGAAVQRRAAKFEDVLFNFAVQYAHDHPDMAPGFPVTDAAVDGFYRELVEAGLEVDRAVYDGARRYIERRLGQRIAHARWGDQESRRRMNADDPQFRLAEDLLREAVTPSSLFSLAERYNAARLDGDAGVAPAGANALSGR